MRRLAPFTAGLTFVATLSFVQVAGASQVATATEHVNPGGVWTLEINGGSCEVQTFKADHKWSADQNGDAGTYTGGGSKVEEEWTSGLDKGAHYSGVYKKKSKEYKGTYVVGSVTAELVKGAIAGC
jgi:hypothetical protein